MKKREVNQEELAATYLFAPVMTLYCSTPCLFPEFTK
jgi:hypothetical protein